MSRITYLSAFALVLAAAPLSAPSVLAQDVKLPSALTLTAYDTGSSGFNIAVAVGKTLKDKQGSDVRVLPAGNDVARLAPLRANAHRPPPWASACYFAQESVFEFAVKEWGPQQLRLMLASPTAMPSRSASPRTPASRRCKDLKGKRIGMVVGSPALNQNAFAVLAFGGLTRNDVKLVEFSSYGAMWKGMVNNEVDAAIASNISRPGQGGRDLAARPPLPADSGGRQGGVGAAEQDRPVLTARTRRPAAPASRPVPVELPSYPYPIFIAYASQPADLVYNLTKAMIANYGAYKDARAGRRRPRTQASRTSLGCCPITRAR